MLPEKSAPDGSALVMNSGKTEPLWGYTVWLDISATEKPPCVTLAWVLGYMSVLVQIMLIYTLLILDASQTSPKLQVWQHLCCHLLYVFGQCRRRWDKAQKLAGPVITWRCQALDCASVKLSTTAYQSWCSHVIFLVSSTSWKPLRWKFVPSMLLGSTEYHRWKMCSSHGWAFLIFAEVPFMAH